MKKFLIWGGSILAVIVLLITLNFTLFSLNNINITFHNATVLFADTEYNSIIESGEFETENSVFFMDKQSHIDKIEKEYPYLKVINLEIQFPNNLVIHCIEREPIFAIQTDTNVLICDEDFKVLEVETELNYISTQNNCILIEGITLENELAEGDFISINETPLLKLISPAFQLNNRNIYEQRCLIKEIEITMTASVINARNTYAIILKDFNNLNTLVVDASDKLEYKLNIFLALQSQIINTSEKYLLVYEKLDSTIVAQERSITELE